MVAVIKVRPLREKKVHFKSCKERVNTVKYPFAGVVPVELNGIATLSGASADWRCKHKWCIVRRIGLAALATPGIEPKDQACGWLAWR